MTTIYERVTTALNTLSPAVPFAMAPYKSIGELPDKYLAYQLITGAQEQSADDSETQRSYLIQVSTFSRSGLISLPNVDGAMLAAGFQKSNERQLPQDQQTGHYGLAQDYIYL
ncbi:MAG: hypothetical protein ABI904_23230 [Chloroflexota bacterium]